MYASLSFYKLNAIVLYTLNKEIIITAFKGIKIRNTFSENRYLKK
ncbi:replication protein [Clostridium botulinum]|uniref:Replication protein n=1 Tax=Clostridium botulinum TaxID=1491 RepID=A0A846I294_CLOBO|nr:replication protein [Clostridium botulinum]EDT86926.1 phage replication protein [Clostridium botulinum Bf]AXG93488.1 replication protein [Clostridium botulinum]MBN3396297.1 replication protein [Clostridium botulinum]MBN3411529.1 replication protein [Clostridium botulinum]